MGITDRLPSPPRWLVLVFRVVQLLSAFISMILYAVFIARVATGSAGADRLVVGIAAAAVVWTISALIQQWWKKSHSNDAEADVGKDDKGAPAAPTHSKRKKVAIAVVMFLVLDVIFVGLMIASAAISGRRQSCQMPDEEDDNDNGNVGMMSGYNGSQCGLQKGVLALSIVNTLSFSGSGIMELIHGMHMPPNPADAHSNAKSLFQELF